MIDVNIQYNVSDNLVCSVNIERYCIVLLCYRSLIRQCCGIALIEIVMTYYYLITL